MLYVLFKMMNRQDMISLIIWPPYLRLPPLPLLHGKVQMQIMACVVYEAFLNLGIFPKSLSDWQKDIEWRNIESVQMCLVPGHAEAGHIRKNYFPRGLWCLRLIRWNGDARVAHVWKDFCSRSHIGIDQV
jgi:hypothetical protein